MHLIQNPFTFLQGQRPCFFCRSVFLLICSWLRKGNSLNITKKSSLEGRNSASGLFRKEDGSLVMKRSAEKNRIQEWLNVNRVQSPLRSSIMDSVETILYDIVNSLYDNNLSDRSENAGARKQQITIAKGIVTPSVRRELMKIGVKIGEAEQLNNPPKPADVLSEDGVSFSDRESTAEETAAEKEFGTTKDFNEAGYILADGKLLNFGKDGDRTIDHRAIGKVFGVDVDINVNNGFNEESNKHMISFINSGNIRPEPGGRRPYPSSLVSFIAQ